jgi:hypothetical protein
MAELFTPNYGFVKPQPGTGEPQDIAKINTNFDLADKFAHVIWVNDGVTPATGDLIEGATVAEITSGKVWIAKKNVGGTFDKKWLRYPYVGVFSDTPNIASGGAYSEWGHNTFGNGKNASVAQITAGRFVTPVDGIWSFTSSVRWNGSGASGDRWLALAINGGFAQIDYSSEVIGKPEGVTGLCSLCTTYTRYFAAGTTVVSFYKQTSGATLTATSALSASLIAAG